MFETLEKLELRYREVEARLADPATLENPQELGRLAKERAELEEIVGLYREYKKVLEQIEDTKHLLEEGDHEIRELAKAELPALRARKEALEEEIKLRLVPKDPNDEKNVILEIRAGTGGEEAALFAAELFRMYSRYAEKRGWKVEVLSAHPTGIGGMKEVIALVEGRGAYSRLKFEGGVHRVQRVPVTEASGRIHTSAVTVAVLPEADEVEVEIDEAKDLRIDVFRSSGPGGQSVNTTDSAVRITHLPTGLVVTCQDEKSQHKNKAKALKILRSRLLERAREERKKTEAATRRSMVGTGDRSERIRTYNFPQGRVTDHRIHLTLHDLQGVLDGNLDPLLDALAASERAQALEAGTA
ncbi:MAG: peptide chain release factor 1 [Candidatus Binatia bacterium]|nr:MAG: peptide chain release factor 1 [Candidatus Binatia bacterium]